jgi:hypothetical protein
MFENLDNVAYPPGPIRPGTPAMKIRVCHESLSFTLFRNAFHIDPIQRSSSRQPSANPKMTLYHVDKTE